MPVTISNYVFGGVLLTFTAGTRLELSACGSYGALLHHDGHGNGRARSPPDCSPLVVSNWLLSHFSDMSKVLMVHFRTD